MDRYIAIVDYGAGNLFSMKNALDYIGRAKHHYFGA